MGYETLLSMRTEVRDNLGESDEDGYWGNAKLNRFINRGVVEFARKSRCVEGCWSQDVQAGKQNYSAPVEMLQGSCRLIQFEEPGQEPVRMEFLEERRFHHEYPRYSGGVPQIWSIWRHCIYLGPTPQWYAESALRVIVEGTSVFIRMPDGSTHVLGVSPINILGEQLCAMEVVAATHVSLTGDNRLVVNLPDDNHLVYATAAGIDTGAASMRLIAGASSIKARYPDGTYTAELFSAAVDSWHGTMHIHGYRIPEKFVEDTDGCEIHDDYASGPVNYATYAALNSDRRYAEARVYKEDFDVVVNEANLWARKHQSDQRNGVQTGREELGRAPTHRRAI